MGHGRREIVITPLESSTGAMEELGRYGQKPFTREAFGYIANMRVHAKRLLHDEQTRHRGPTRRTRHVKPHGRSVTHLGGNKFAFDLHCAPPLIRREFHFPQVRLNYQASVAQAAEYTGLAPLSNREAYGPIC